MKKTKTYIFNTWNFILLFVPLFFCFVSPVYAVDVSFQWDPNSEPDLAGYRVFSREKGQSYNYTNPSWEGTDTMCTIYVLDGTKTYYFVSRSFDTQGLESSDSKELYLEAATTPANQIADVPTGHWAEEAIYKIYDAGITKGCSADPLLYCPDKSVSKEVMAVFLLRSLHGGNYTPPPATGNIFTDVNGNEWYAPWVEQLYKEGITKGCSESPLKYCPDRPVSRAVMALFLVRAFDL